MAWVGWVEILAWVAWVYKIGEDRNFDVGNVVVRMAWVQKVFFKFLLFFFHNTNKNLLIV